MGEAPTYVLGHSDLEIERLQLQASLIDGITSRLIRECGIAPGMNVLDIGCGAGDVSMLVADAVGPSGKVVAFDREPRAIETARIRSQKRGYRNIEFVVTSDEEWPKHAPFDAAIGRYILPHQADPVAMVRRAAASVRPGGVVAFHEIAFGYQHQFQTLPTVEVYDKISQSLGAVFEATLPQPLVGNYLAVCFEDAGLPTPRLIWECVVGDHKSGMARWTALTYRSMLPHIQRLGLEVEGEDDLDTLTERLQAALAAVRAQVVSRPQTCAWAIRPL